VLHLDGPTALPPALVDRAGMEVVSGSGTAESSEVDDS
jgi:hypothetical protein